MISMLRGACARLSASMTLLFVAVFALSGLALPGAAAAQSLIGAQVSYAQNYPNIGSLFYAQGPFTVGSGVEFTVAQGGLLSIDVTATQIIVTATGSNTFNAPVSHNGPVLTFNTTINSATVDPSSTFGYNAISTTSNAVRIDLQGVTFTTGQQLFINVDAVSVVVAPTVTGLSPASGSAAGGSLVTLTGTNFTGATDVAFGGVSATGITVVNDTTITATSPAHAVGVVNVAVTTPGGTSDTTGAGDDFTYVGVSGITPGSLSNAAVAAAYNATLTATDCAGPCTFAVTAGALPPGVSLASDGVLSGTPTAGGAFNFTVTATDAGAGGLTAGQAYTLTVDAPAISLPGGVLTGATAGAAYSQPVSASGGTGPYSYAVTAGALPAGLSLSSAGLLSGTATASGAFNFTITATDSSTGTGPFTGSGAYSLSVAGPDIALAPASLPNAAVASAYSQSITASGGTAPYSYSIVAGALPAGLSFTSAGLLSGTPTAGGTFNFTVSVQDSTGGAGPHAFARPYTLTVAAPTITLSPATLPNATVAVSGYSQTITASGGVGTYTYALTAGALPAGMSLSSAGVLSGTPTAGGSFNFTITATDQSTGTGPFTGSRAYNLTVNAAAIVVTPTTVPAATRGFAYSQAFSATGGVGTYSYTVSAGALPPGVTLSSAGVLSGTPTTAGSFTFTVRAQDQATGAGPYSGTVSITMAVNAATITVTPTALPGVMAGVAYDRSFSATGGSGAYTYAVTSGALPAGITLSSTGRLSGVSYAVGSYPITVTATDAFGNAGTVSVVLNILARPDPSADPDVRGLDAAQADATRRLATVQIDNVNRRLEQLHSGAGNQPMSMGLNLNSGVAELGRAADLRTQLGRGRMFDRQTPDADRAELNGMLWSASVDATAFGSASDKAGFGSNTGMGVGGLNAAPTPSGDGPSGGLRFWTGGAITFGERDGDTGQSKFSIHSGGLSVGADMALSPTLDFGLAGGFGEESADIGAADSSVESRQFVGMAYGSWRPRAGVYLDAMLGYGQLEFDLQRRATGDNSLVTGQRDGTAVFGSVGLGFDRSVAVGHVNAYGRVESVEAELDAYTETGSALWALSYAERDVESLQGVLGARYAWAHEERDSVWTPSFRIEYRHEFADGGLQSLQYADWAAGPVYQIQSTGWDRSEFALDLGLNVTTSSGWKATGELGGRFSTGQTLGTLRFMLSRKF